MVTRALGQGLARPFLAGPAAIAAFAWILIGAAGEAWSQPEPASEAASAAAPEPAPTSAPAAKAAPAPRVHHVPVSVAQPDEALTLEITLEHPERVRSVVAVYKPANGPTRSVPFQKSSTGTYVALIPAEAVVAPALGYTIEIERTTGEHVAAFASRGEMHTVEIIEAWMDARERALLDRLGGRRSVVTAGGELALFGETKGLSHCPTGVKNCSKDELIIPEANEQLWTVELSYTYRPLRTVAEFSLRGGVTRGRSLHGNESDSEVGLNYGAPSVRFRISDFWHTDLEFLISITDQGFALGEGASLIIGDPYATNIRFGFESIGFGDKYFGNRFYSRLDIAASQRFVLSPIIEVTDVPSSDKYGVRLLAEGAVNLGYGFTVSARGGYQARQSSSGGIGFGGKLALAF